MKCKSEIKYVEQVFSHKATALPEKSRKCERVYSVFFDLFLGDESSRMPEN